MTAQPGIFALGNVEHCFLEFDLDPAAAPLDLILALGGMIGPETTVAGVALTLAFRPELWSAVMPADAPLDVASFEEIRGPEYTMPATQHDAWAWIAGGSRDVVFDSALRVIAAVVGVGSVASELTGWVYQHERDLTGFIDGTENPSTLEAPEVALAATGPGSGSSVLLYQKWQHLPTFARLSVADQERVIGRTKADSIELAEDVMPADSHVSRNVIEENGEELAIYRRNVAYGGPSDHGTVFVGFCATQHPLQAMLERMAGVGDGVRDALTRYTTALSGAYYLTPALEPLRALVEASPAR